MPYPYTEINHFKPAARAGGENFNRYFTLLIQPPTPSELDTIYNGSQPCPYKFKPPPPQYDEVVYTIKLIIRQMNRDNMLFASRRLRVHRTNESPPFYPPSPFYQYQHYDSKMYTFIDDINEFPLTAWVSIIPKWEGPSAESLHIKIGGEWRPLKQWLHSQMTETPDPNRYYGVAVLQKWWRVNGKMFRLLDLPAEVRNIFYEHALGPRLYPLSTVSRHQSYNVAQASTHSGFGHLNAKDPLRGHYKYQHLYRNDYRHATTDYSVEALNTALLQVSKLVYEEARKVGWESIRKCFYNVERFSLVLRTGNTPNFNWLNKIVLDFDMRDWFRFLGVQTHPQFRIEDANSYGHLLQNLPQLANLQISFGSPYDGYEYLPLWGLYGAAPQKCCQHTMIDWIITFLWPFIIRIRKVILGGAIKRASKRKWDDMLAQPLDKKQAFDRAYEQFKILNTSHLLLPPPCSCRTSCRVDYNDRRHTPGGCTPGTDKFDYEDGDDGDLTSDFETLNFEMLEV